MSDQDLQPPRPPTDSPLSDEDRWAVLLLVARHFPDMTPIQLATHILAAEKAWLDGPASEHQVYEGSRVYWRAILADVVIKLNTSRELEAMVAGERPDVRRSDPALPPLVDRVRHVLAGLHDQAFDAALVVDDELADVLRAWLKHRDHVKPRPAPLLQPGIRIENCQDDEGKLSFDAYLCDTTNGMEIWSGNGPDPLWAVMTLAENIAVECDNRAQYLPEGYQNVRD